MKIKLHYSLQNKKVMQQHIYYIRFALRFADMQISELVTVFNAQVQNLRLRLGLLLSYSIGEKEVATIARLHQTRASLGK